MSAIFIDEFGRSWNVKLSINNNKLIMSNNADADCEPLEVDLINDNITIKG